MKTGNIKVNLYTFLELSERAQRSVKARFLSYFKKHVRPNETLFLHDGTIFCEDELSFKGLNCTSIEVEE